MKSPNSEVGTITRMLDSDARLKCKLLVTFALEASEIIQMDSKSWLPLHI